MNTPDNKAMNTPDNDSGGFGGLLAVAGGVLVMVACCAGPALIAGGVLAGLGGVLTSPWLLAAGVLVVAAAVGYTLRRRARKATGCCPPRPGSPRSAPADRDRTETSA